MKCLLAKKHIKNTPKRIIIQKMDSALVKYSYSKNHNNKNKIDSFDYRFYFYLSTLLSGARGGKSAESIVRSLRL